MMMMMMMMIMDGERAPRNGLAASALVVVFEGLAWAHLDLALLVCLWLYIGLHSVVDSAL
jgi:hypothetical protein